MVQSTWIKLSNYCIKSGDYLIAKFINNGAVKYGLTYKDKHIDYFNTADEAKASIK
jgi:hypothetical protein